MDTEISGDEAARGAILRERAEALVPVLAERAPEAEKLRMLPPETVADIKAAGLHRLCQPLRFGGAELPLDAAIGVVATLARGCASTAWVCGIFTDHSIITGMFGPAAADDVWGDDADNVISAGYLPQGSAERVDGGWRLTGTWGWVSGCDYADWFLFGSPLPTGDGEITPSLCLVPRSETAIEDNWHVMGLAATGSKNVSLDGAFVPDHRALSMAAMNGGAEARGQVDVPPLYRLPHVTAVPFLFDAIALGIADSLLQAMTAQMGGRASFGNPIAEFQTVQMHFAEAAAEIDCARQLVMRDSAEAMAAMRAGRPLTLAEKARNRRDQAYACKLCRQAVDRMFGTAGARGIFNDNVAQRKFRDMCAVGSHIATNWDVAGTVFGRVSFGLDPATHLI